MPTAPMSDRQARSLGEPVIPARDHQPDLLNKVVAELQPQPGAGIPEKGLRVTLAAAPGSGKTWISREVARRLAPRRRVLVMVHTLDLLVQTVAWWRTAGHTEPGIAVCSPIGNAEELKELGVRCTTSAPRLALWGGSGPVTVFATYASLAYRRRGGEIVPGPLEEAMAGLYGQQLAPFDLAVVDEAHRTSGARGKPWAIIHDNTRIRADRRLYMTATPRLWEIPESVDGKAGPARGEEGVGGQLVASMDDEEIYGRQIGFGLLEAIERGVLARFEIDVLEIRDPAAQDELTEQQARERRLAALQAALLTRWKESGLRSVLSFHHRTRDAMGFARSLPSVATDLYESDPGRYPDPARTVAEWLSGEHPLGYRRQVVGRFADGLDDDGAETVMSFLATCKVLGEGADITGRRGVDAVVFADTRGSVVDVVQNTGRALRQTPGEGKIARVLVPIFLRPDEDPQDMVSSPSYRPLVAVLQALRAHDEQIIEKLVLRQEHSGRGTADEVLVDDPQYIRDTGTGQEQQGAEKDGGAAGCEGMPGDAALLRFFAPRDAITVARFLRTRVLQPQSEVWLTGYHLLCRWVAGHGHARVPLQERVPRSSQAQPGDGWERDYALGQWCAEQRRAHRDGTLRAWRFQLLDELGMEWEGADARFAAKIAVYRRYYDEHGTLAAPLAAVFEGQPVGQELSNLRKPHGLGKKPERAQRRRELLEAIDPDWNPQWPLAWQRRWAKVKWCLDGGAQLADLRPGLMVDGEDVGAWIAEQHLSWQGLSAGQRERLAVLGIRVPAGELETAALPALEAAGAVVLPATATPWERGTAALRQYKAREGHVRVPRAHRETIRIDHGDDGLREEHVRLGIWRSNTRSRRDRLTDTQRQEAQRLGLLT
ncbi:DEAD/DEAH box helicase [Streptomyces mobaraensis]|uniref:DEAD/DEAH box helicase n=2 Tax=Streptomyces mobaraensis TaxID=35621 RepID=UPI0003479950